ncbi:MAG: ABC transporter ATP-binding protein [Bacilli bacterium]|nr:ABC transporter ATP-binding protein [Bacilli bacterium]
MANRSFEEEKLPEKLNFGVWLKIGRYAIRHWKLLLLLLFTMLVTTFYDTSFVPSMNKAAIDITETLANVAHDGADIWNLKLTPSFIGIKAEMPFSLYTAIFVAMIVLRSAAVFGTFFLTNYIGMRIMIDLRRDSFEKIQLLSFSYFDKTSSGWLIARLQNDTSSIGDTLSWGIIQMVWASLDIIFSLITMFTMDWRLSLVVLASLPLVIIIVPAFEKAVLKRHRTARNAYSHYVGWLAESIDGAKTIKTLAIEDEVEKEADEITEDVKTKRYRAGRLNAFFQPSISLISTVMVALIIMVGLWSRADLTTTINAALIVVFISFVRQIYDPIQEVAETFSEFMATQAGAEKIMQLLEAVPSIQDKPDVIKKYGDILHPKKENYEAIEGDILFDHVSFDYGNGVKVIDDLNLHIEKGTSLAIVGETGSGKTTTVNLLCRFYEPSEGDIKIDGLSYLDRSLGWLRSNIGYVQQVPYVFSGTYRENIAYGKPDAALEEIEKAAKMVGMHDFIMAQEKGYDTFLADGGSTLSQGQKQLISYARAIIRDPAILILDEATSSIDTETEKELQEATNSLLKGRTSIIIAHRLSTIVGADRILLMDHGLIKEDGNHQELMAKKGAYYSLYMNQFRDLSIESQIEDYKNNIEGKGIKL